MNSTSLCCKVPQSGKLKDFIHLENTSLELQADSFSTRSVWQKELSLIFHHYKCPSKCVFGEHNREQPENETMFLTKYVKPRCELRKAPTKARLCDCGKPRCSPHHNMSHFLFDLFAAEHQNVAGGVLVRCNTD